MCLNIKKPLKESIVIAKKDIYVWKYLIFENGVLLSPYRGYKYEIDELVKVKFSKKELNEMSVSIGLHTYRNLMSVFSINKDERNDYVVAKCIIPKGSRYVKGTFVHESYASEELKVISIHKFDDIKPSLLDKIRHSIFMPL